MLKLEGKKVFRLLHPKKSCVYQDLCLIFNHRGQSSSNNLLKYVDYKLDFRERDSRPKGSGFEPHRPHCVVVLKQDTFILA